MALAALGPASRLALYARANADALASLRPVALVAVAAATFGVTAAGAISWSRRRSPAVVGAVVGAIGHLGFGAAVFGDGVLTRPLLWALTCALAGVGVADLARRRWPRLALLVLAAVVTGVGVHGAVGERATLVAPTEGVGSTGLSRRPDVWLFIADGLGRGDQLELFTDHDATGFAAALAQRGLEVDPAATVGYGETHWSMASLLQQEYPAVSGSTAALAPASAQPIVQGDNPTVERLRAEGYRYVHASAGLIDWLACDPERADLCIEPGAEHRIRWSEATRSLIELTPLGPAARATGGFTDAVADPVGVVEQVLDRRPEAGRGPLFVYSHLMSPHPPYRVDARCEPLDEPVGDVSVGWADQHRAPYAAQTACLERQLLEAVDRIQAEDPSAIIVIAGDHGPAFEMSFGPLSMFTPALLAERFTAFRALGLPDACRSDDPRASAMVNVLRVVEACLRGREPRLLPVRSFVTFGPTVEELDADLVDQLTG
jgi:hypothetical protein